MVDRRSPQQAPTRELFDLFWQAYPRRVAKADAAKAFVKLNPTPELLHAMLTALDWQRATWNDPQYIPYPATWLRGERWEDEPPPEKANDVDAVLSVLRGTGTDGHHGTERPPAGRSLEAAETRYPREVRTGARRPLHRGHGGLLD